MTRGVAGGIYHGGAYSGRYLFGDHADEAIAGETK